MDASKSTNFTKIKKTNSEKSPQFKSAHQFRILLKNREIFFSASTSVVRYVQELFDFHFLRQLLMGVFEIEWRSSTWLVVAFSSPSSIEAVMCARILFELSPFASNSDRWRRLWKTKRFQCVNLTVRKPILSWWKSLITRHWMMRQHQCNNLIETSVLTVDKTCLQAMAASMELRISTMPFRGIC